jgi:hypothetical protein
MIDFVPYRGQLPTSGLHGPAPKTSRNRGVNAQVSAPKCNDNEERGSYGHVVKTYKGRS